MEVSVDVEIDCPKNKPESVTSLYSHGILSAVGEGLSKETSENVFGRTLESFRGFQSGRSHDD